MLDMGVFGCGFPYVPTNMKESMEMRKLSQIWQSIPNTRISAVLQAAAKFRPKTFALAGAVQGETLRSATNAVLARYAEYRDNSYFLSLALSRDIYDAVRTQPAGAPRLPIGLCSDLTKTAESDEATACSGCSTGTSTGRAHYRLSENVTFAEITNRLNCGMGNKLN